MKPRLKQCCFSISLRLGCLMIALILIFFELIAIPQRNPGPPESLKGMLVAAYRLLNMFHSIGCLVLLVAYFVKFSGLVRVFLVTNALHIIITPVFLVFELLFWGSDPIDVGIAFGGIFLSLYFWVVAHAFYHQCREEKFVERASMASDGEPRRSAAAFVAVAFA